jgi:hypothetical protein
MLDEVCPTVFDDVTVEFGPLGRGHWMLRDQLDDLSMAGDTAIITGWSSPHLYRVSNVSICFDMIYIYIDRHIYIYGFIHSVSFSMSVCFNTMILLYLLYNV